MAPSRFCPSCGVRLTPDSTASGLCLACLLTTALGPDDEIGGVDAADAPPSWELAPGATLGRFRIVRLLGRGGMAAVYEAVEGPPLERTVALKVLPPGMLHEETFAGRFAQEARLVASLEHTHIVPIYASGIDDGVPWMSMRLLAGGNLSALLHGDRIPVARAIATLTDVAEALDCAHAAGVIHRDIKPSNILLDHSGRAWVSDFGLARLVERSASLTMTGAVAGTPHYMAPEQALGLPLDRSCDIYSLGVVAYEMLSGAPPFDGNSPIAVLMRHVNEAVPAPPRELVPEAVFAVLTKALAKNPQGRWPSASAFVTALETSLVASPVRTQAALRRHGLKAAAAIALVVMGAVLFVRENDAPAVDGVVASEPGPLASPQAQSAAEPSPAPEPETPSPDVMPRGGPGRRRPPAAREAPAAAPTAEANPVLNPPPVHQDELASNHLDADTTAEPQFQPVEADTPAEPQFQPAEIPTPAPDPLPPGEPAADVVTRPVLIAEVKARYPDIAMRLNIQGDVIIRVLVGPDGRATPLTVIESPHQTLSEAARRAVQQYRYKPAMRNGEPIPAQVDITVRFHLR